MRYRGFANKNLPEKNIPTGLNNINKLSMVNGLIQLIVHLPQQWLPYLQSREPNFPMVQCE